MSYNEQPISSQFVYNVKNYGAKGDGITDDTNAIQAAIDACPISGEVFFPPTVSNSYLITRPLLISSNANKLGIVLRGTSRAIDGELPSFQTHIIASFTTTTGTDGYISSLFTDGYGVPNFTITSVSGFGANYQIGDTITLSGARVTTVTSGGFLQPAVGASITINCTNTDWMSGLIGGGVITIDGYGMYYVNTIINGTQVNITNTIAIGNASPGTTIPAGAQITPGLWGTAANNFSYTISSVGTHSLTAIANFDDELTSQLLNTYPEANSGSLTWTITKPMLRLYSRECTIEKLRFDGQNTVAACIDSTWDQLPTLNNTNNNFFDCSFGRAIYGIKIADIGLNGTPYLANCENYVIERCNFNNMAHSCVNIPNTTGQSKSHRVSNFTFVSAPFGWWQRSGSFTLARGGSSLVTNCLIVLIAPTEPIHIYDMDCENAARIYTSASTTDSSVTLDGIRVDYSASANMAADGLVIRVPSRNGGHRISNSHFVVGQAASDYGTIAIGLSAGAIIENCVFGRADGYITRGLGGGSGSFLSINNAYDAGGPTNIIQNGIRYVNRFDNIDANNIVPYTSTPWVTQSQLMQPDRVNAFSWTIVATNNDLAAVPNTVCLINTASVDFAITGLVAPVTEGEVRILMNVTAHNMTINNGDVGSSALNRIYTTSGAAVTCKVFSMIYLANVTTPGWYELNHS